MPLDRFIKFIFALPISNTSAATTLPVTSNATTLVASGLVVAKLITVAAGLGYTDNSIEAFLDSVILQDLKSIREVIYILSNNRSKQYSD